MKVSVFGKQSRDKFTGKRDTLRHNYTTSLKPTQVSENAPHIRRLLGKHHLPSYCESALLPILTCTDGFFAGLS